MSNSKLSLFSMRIGLRKTICALLFAVTLNVNAESDNHSSNEAKKVGNLEIWPSLKVTTPQAQEIESRISDIMAKMTVEQKVAQMIQPEIRDVTVADMRRYGFGSYLNGGGAFPNNNKHAKPADWVQLAEDMYQASVDDSLDGSTIPTMWGTDAVHGHNNVIGATLFPHNIGLGAANNPQLIEQIARVTASEVLATGIDWIFAPTVAVVRDDRWGRTYEGYSEDPEIVRSYSSAIIHGLQGHLENDFLGDGRVVATIKHFVGDGGTQNGVDQGNNIASEQELYDIHAQGYVGGLAAGAQTVMASFNSWQGNKVHGHHYLLTEVLKNKMGFDGFIVGDWLGHGQVPGCSNQSCSAAINAGLDVFMVSGHHWKPLMENTISQVKKGDIPQSRVDDAVRRILRVKLRAGLFDKPSPAQRMYSKQPALIGAAEHRKIARQAVRESLVLLKNKNAVLPINPQQRVLVAGSAANNIGKQSGGWTITWQGTGNTNEEFPGASSIFDGIKLAVTKAGGSVELSESGEFTEKPDIAIVVFGEEPYAEGNGDIDTLEYQVGNKTDLKLLKHLKSHNIPVVSVFISGRPLWVNPELNASDAFVAAWLPGSEGAGVSDVLFSQANGKIAHDFTGKLSFSWPANPHQTSLNRHDSEYQPLLPYGFGLQYGDKDVLADQLPVQVNPIQQASNSLVLFNRTVKAPFQASLISHNQHLLVSSNLAELGALKTRTIDRFVQEDARQLSFSGDAPAAYALISEHAHDFRELNAESASLSMIIRIEDLPNGPVSLGMECGAECKGEIDITERLKSSPLNEWVEMNIALACFEKAGANLSNITTPLSIRSLGQLTLSFSKISVANTSSESRCS